MKGWIDGFFMAWGMFLTVPCPCLRWNEQYRSRMLGCFPLIGMITGLGWALLYMLLNTLRCPKPFEAFLMAAYPWLITGFIHLDGYMDVCDAVLSRRELKRRQELLKDPHCGAFAVISMVLLALCQFSLFASTEEFALLPLMLVPVSVRCCAGIAMLTMKPIETSQYKNTVATQHRSELCFLSLLLFSTAVVPILLYGLRGVSPFVAVAGYRLSIVYGYKQLGGISGDVSGFALSIGELAGVAALTLLR